MGGKCVTTVPPWPCVAKVEYPFIVNKCIWNVIPQKTKTKTNKNKQSVSMALCVLSFRVEVKEERT